MVGKLPIVTRYTIEPEPNGKIDETRILPIHGERVSVGSFSIRIDSLGQRVTVRPGRQESVDEAWVRLERQRVLKGTDYIAIPLPSCAKKMVQNLLK